MTRRGFRERTIRLTHVTIRTLDTAELETRAELLERACMDAGVSEDRRAAIAAIDDPPVEQAAATKGAQ